MYDNIEMISRGIYTKKGEMIGIMGLQLESNYIHKLVKSCILTQSDLENILLDHA